MDERTGQHDLWQVATVLEDRSGAWTLPDVQQRTAEFSAAGPLKGNLGRRAGAVWMRVPLQTQPGGAGHWVLNVDYPPLDRVDVYLLDGSRVERHVPLGDHVDRAANEWPARSHVVALDLPPGAQRTLLIRVQSVGTMLVPATLYTPAAFMHAEVAEQALQGLVAGMSLCLLVYTLLHWWLLRDSMFGLYAVTLLGTTAFFAALSGVGPQHVWGASTWLVRNGPPFFILVGVCGAFFFVLRALQVRSISPRVAHVIVASGAVAGLTAGAFALGWVGYSTAQAIGMALGPLPLLLVLPTAFRRLRNGDHAAGYVLAGWGVYSVGVIVIVGLLAGQLPLGFWTLHAFQFASLLEMTMWMLVLAERVHDIRRRAALVQGERDSMHSLAHTDALTGLLNRRGLDVLLPERVAMATAEQPLALYMLDLDGFKEVNDTLGHDAGDLLLQEVAQRLRRQLGDDDLVCRLGGDEFVVVAQHIKTLDAAQVLAERLRRAFDSPAQLGSLQRKIGVTVGYAVAPHDGQVAMFLMKRADAAMYAGKQAGKNRVGRTAPPADAGPQTKPPHEAAQLDQV